MTLIEEEPNPMGPPLFGMSQYAKQYGIFYLMHSKIVWIVEYVGVGSIHEDLKCDVPIHESPGLGG